MVHDAVLQVADVTNNAMLTPTLPKYITGTPLWYIIPLQTTN